MPQVFLPDFVNVNPIISDFSILNVIKPVQQIGNGRLSCTCCPSKSHFLPCSCKNLNIVQNCFSIGVSKIHMIKYHIPLHRLIGSRIICLMIMLPRPHTGPIRNLGQISLFIIACIHQLHISAVLFRLFIQ